METPKKKERKENEIPQMPFDDALRRIISAPPSPKITKKPAKKKTGN